MSAYIYIGFQNDYSKICMSKYINKEGSYSFEYLGHGRIKNKLQKIHCCETVNKYIELPLKYIWFDDFSALDLNRQEDIYFIFSKSQSWLLQYKDGLYIKILREKYINCRIILYLCDLIDSYYKFDAKFFKEKCNEVISYDLGDANKYGLIYCPLPYSKVEIEDDASIENFDVYFCGKAKNRLPEILEVYSYLKSKNLKCKFFVSDVPYKMQKFREDITYNKKLSYMRNLQYVKKTKFILEIIQKNSAGDTLRVKEAVTYGKKLITNNKNVKNNNYYNSNNICIFENPNEISDEWLQNNKFEYYKTSDFDEFERIINKITMGGVIR